MIAALCHDLGHGPFSHVFDQFYMKQVKHFNDITHEQLSVNMLKHLIEQNNLRPLMSHYGLHEDHVELIGDIINPTGKYGEEFQRLKKRMFLYEIVNNTKNGIDVDKWDYFARDCLLVNITNSFDYRRLVKFSRVLLAEDESAHICFRDKEAENLSKMFELRYDLHRQVYSHKATHVIHLMLSDALIRADNHLDLLIPEHGRRLETFAAFVKDMEAFSKITDTTVWQILQTNQRELADSKKILSDIQTRRFYPSFRTCPSTRKPDNELTIKNALEKLVNNELDQENSGRLSLQQTTDIVVKCIKLDYSKGDDDPINDVDFYDKYRPTTMIKLPDYKKIRLSPAMFCQHIVSVCWKNLDHEQHRQIVSCLKKAFTKWCENAGYMPYF